MSQQSDDYQPDGFDLMSKETLALVARELLAKVQEVKAENERLHDLTEGDLTSIYAEAARMRAAITEARDAIGGQRPTASEKARELDHFLAPLWASLDALSGSTEGASDGR